MTYKPYPKEKDTASRMARKHMRREVFVSNKKIAKTQKKIARLERRQKEAE